MCIRDRLSPAAKSTFGQLTPTSINSFHSGYSKRKEPVNISNRYLIMCMFHNFTNFFYDIIGFIKTEREREREHQSRRTVYLACLPGLLKWWSTSIPAREWQQCHCSLYLTFDFRKPLNEQFILGIASTNTSLTIRLSRDTQHKLIKYCIKCNLFESFVGCDAVYIILLKKNSSV